MNPHYHKINLGADDSFSVLYELGASFYNQWHYHSEIELAYIIEGSGTLFIGDSVHNFKADDLLIIGSNLPHMLKSNNEYYINDSGLKSEATMIHFLPQLFNSSFLSLPENKDISKLLYQSSYGININIKESGKLQSLMHDIRYAQNGERIIKLLQILNNVAQSEHIEVMSHKKFGKPFNSNDEHRLNRIYHYTLNNFLKNITLEEIANVVHMCPHSFCRYFKSRTKKTYSTFLLEIKVSHACKLLMETNYTAGMICYESGFTNMSNFNRHFKAITGKTPLEYRKHLSGGR